MKIFQKIENLVLFTLEKNIFPIFWSKNSKIVGEKKLPLGPSKTDHWSFQLINSKIKHTHTQY
jgi:hypothetical protein